MLHYHCSICQESYKETCQIAALDCGHVFHSDCIASWLHTRPSCPHCRKSINGDYITKLYFDKLSNVNDSLIETSQSDINDIDNLHCEIGRLRAKCATILDEKKQLENQLDLAREQIDEAQQQLRQTEDLQREQYFLFTNQIFEKNDQIEKYVTKLRKLNFLNDLLNKKESQIKSEVDQISKSGSAPSEIDKLVSSLLVCKSELDLYKNKSESLLKQSNRWETKNRILETEINQLKAKINSFDGEISSDYSRRNALEDKENQYFHNSNSIPSGSQRNSNPLTPVSSSRFSLKRNLSTPEALLFSPCVPGSALKRRIHQEAIASNPFRSSPKYLSTKNRPANLLKLSIMKSHCNRAHPGPIDAKPTHIPAPSVSVLSAAKTENAVKKKKAHRSKFIQPIRDD